MSAKNVGRVCRCVVHRASVEDAAPTPGRAKGTAAAGKVSRKSNDADTSPAAARVNSLSSLSSHASAPDVRRTSVAAISPSRESGVASPRNDVGCAPSRAPKLLTATRCTRRSAPRLCLSVSLHLHDVQQPLPTRPLPSLPQPFADHPCAHHPFPLLRSNFARTQCGL